MSSDRLADAIAELAQAAYECRESEAAADSAYWTSAELEERRQSAAERFIAARDALPAAIYSLRAVS